MIPVFQDKIVEVWPAVAQLLGKGLELYSDIMTMQEVIQNLVEGKWQLWMVYTDDAIVYAATSEILIRSTGRKSLNMVLSGGSMLDEWLPTFLAALDDFAKEHRCADIWMTGRAGWARVGAPYGYRQRLVTLVKEVEKPDE